MLNRWLFCVYDTEGGLVIEKSTFLCYCIKSKEGFLIFLELQNNTYNMKESFGQKNMTSLVPILCITVLFTAAITGGLVYIWKEAPQDSEGEGGVEQIVPPTSQKVVKKESNITQKPNSGWERYISKSSNTLINKPISEVRELLGEPPVLVRNTAPNPQDSKEVWVYHPYEMDSTGLYLFFKNNILVNSMLDEFSGFLPEVMWDDALFMVQ